MAMNTLLTVDYGPEKPLPKPLATVYSQLVNVANINCFARSPTATGKQFPPCNSSNYFCSVRYFRVFSVIFNPPCGATVPTTAFDV